MQRDTTYVIKQNDIILQTLFDMDQLVLKSFVQIILYSRVHRLEDIFSNPRNLFPDNLF